MLHGYIRFIKYGPSIKTQEAALAGAGLDVKDELAPVYRDNTPKKHAAVKFPELDSAVRALRAGDELVIAEPSIFGGRADYLLKILKGIEVNGAGLRVVSTSKLYSAKVKEWKAEFMAEAIRQGRQRRAHKARKARTPDKLGGRPFRLIKGSACYEAAQAAWANQKLSQAEAAEKVGFSAITLYRHFGAKGTPVFGERKPKRKRAST